MNNNYKSIRRLMVVTGILLVTGILSVFTASAQNQRTVTGRVSDNAGAPIVGVVVSQSGAGSAITDVGGNYSIRVSGDASLDFASVDYVSQTVPVGERTVVNVTMEQKSEAIEGIVVTAMGITRDQRTLGYSMTEVSGSDIAKANVVNPVQGLQGKVAGVQIDMGAGGPQSSQRIVIRGNTSLSGNNQPIFIIDGIIIDNEVTKTGGKADRDFGNELKGLNADDFETVSILKGAAATALYGSRASNGVILITTKKGSKQQGLGISVSQTIQFEDVYRYPDFQHEYGMGTQQLWAQSDGKDVRDNISTTSANWGPKYDGLPYTTGTYKGTWKAYPDNMEPLFQNGFFRNTNVAVQGGTDKSTYRLSYSTMKDSNLSPNNDMKRNNIMFKASHEISKFLTAEASFTYADIMSRNPTKQGGEGSPIYDMIYSVPLNYDTKYWMQNYWSENHDGFNNTDPFGFTDNLFDAFQNNETQGDKTYRGYLKLDFKFTDWLRLALSADMNNLYTKREVKTLASGSSSYENFAGARYTINESSKQQSRLNAMLTANKTFGDFNLGAYVGAESYDERQSFHNSTTGDNGLTVPGLFELYNGVSPATTDALSNYKRKRVNSVFGAINADWKSQLYLEVTARNDWSSAMMYSNGTGNVSYFYPSVNASWLVTESFRDQLPAWMSFLKLRGSYAIVGKDTDIYQITNPGSYEYFSKFTDTMFNGGNYVYYHFINSDMGATNLRPEKQHAIEFGLDYRMFNDRLGIDFSWYKTNTRNQIITLPMSQESGVSRRLINAGNIQNQGIEILITGTPLETKDWRWDLSLNMTRNRNKIIELADGIQTYALPLGGGDTSHLSAMATVGGSYGDIYTSHTFKRDANGNKLLDSSGRWVQSNVETKIGSIQPDFLAGLSSNLTWKSLSLGFTLDARFGGDIFSTSYYYGMEAGKFKSTLGLRTNGLERELADGRKVNDGMIPDGVFSDGVKISIGEGDNKVDHDMSGKTYQDAVDQGLLEPMSPYQYHQNGYSWSAGLRDNGIMESTWISLRDISLSWQVPEKWTSKAFIRNLTVSANVRNVCYLYNSLPDHIFPEALMNNYSAQFIETGGRPYSRRYGFSISLNF